MTNFEIKNAIKNLVERKKEIQMSTFELSEEMIEINNSIKQLRSQCTHTDEDGTFSTDKHSKCRYCGKLMK